MLDLWYKNAIIYCLDVETYMAVSNTCKRIEWNELVLTHATKGPGPGESYLQTDYRHDWSQKTGEAAAANLVAVASALRERPIPVQSS